MGGCFIIVLCKRIKPLNHSITLIWITKCYNCSVNENGTTVNLTLISPNQLWAESVSKHLDVGWLKDVSWSFYTRLVTVPEGGLYLCHLQIKEKYIGMNIIMLGNLKLGVCPEGIFVLTCGNKIALHIKCVSSLYWKLKKRREHIARDFVGHLQRPRYFKTYLRITFRNPLC